MPGIRYIAVILFTLFSLQINQVFAEISNSSESIQLNLTVAEQEWFKNNPDIIFTGDPNWLPYEAFNDKNEYIGIVSEHLSIIESVLGITFKMSPSKTWTESTEKAKEGLVDILSETDDSDLSSHLNFTIPYISNPIVIAMHSRENYVEKINNIKTRSIGLIKDYGYAAKIRRKYSEIDFVTVDDIQDGLIAVSTGEIDALMCTLALCSYTIAELGLNNVKITGKTEFDTKLAFGVQKNLPELLSILNKAIATITQEQQQVILEGWIKEKYSQQIDYSLVYKVIAASILFLSFTLLWNRRLSREISLRIATENKLHSAQDVLRLSKQRLVLHREQTPLGVIEWNTCFEVVDWNPAAERIFGFKKEEVIGRHVTELILPDNVREVVDNLWEDLIANRGGMHSINENITKDGQTILCEWYNTPLIDPNGIVIGVTSLADDITRRKQAEQELEQYRNHLELMVSERTSALETANSELEAFSYSVSHDLRSPLRSIDGISHILLDDYSDKIDEEGVAYIQRVRKSAQYMGKLIDAMLLLSNVTRSELTRKTQNLSNIAINAIKKLKDANPDRKIEITIASGIEGWVDKPLFENLIDNLLGNAWKYTGKTKNPKIEFGSIIKDGELNYFVRDNGAGFNMEYAKKLFGAFQRLHKADQFEGTGIGLATVVRILRRHGGRIWAEAEVDKGATFYFTLEKSDVKDM